MSKLAYVKLDEIASSVDYGHTAPSTSEAIGPKFLRITDIQDDSVDWGKVPFCECSLAEEESSKLKAGDIVFARTGATTGKSFLIKECPERAVFASYLIRVRSKPTVSPNYLAHFFKTPQYWSQISLNARGAAQLGVNATVLKSLSIPLPPIAEQKRIAAILDKAEELRGLRRKVLDELDAIVQSIFLEMFGDPIVNSKEWLKKPFGEVCETRLGKMLDQKKQTGQHSRAYMRNANVQWFRFDLTDVFEMDFDDKDREILRLQYGDLLICEGGEPGRAAIWRDELAECYYQKALHRARPRKDLANSEYLVWLLWFLAHRGGLGDHVTAATIAHLTGEKLKAMKIPIPPLSLQREFAQRVEAIEQLKATHRESLDQLDALFASLQNRAFRGEL